MSWTMGGTTIPLLCSKCGRALTGTYIEMNGERFCSTCCKMQITQFPISIPRIPLTTPDYTADWLKENVRLTEELNQAKARIADLEKINEWNEERRNQLLTLLESYAHTHRQFYFPAITEFDTEDTDVRDDIKALWGIRRQIGELIGIPPLPKADS